MKNFDPKYNDIPKTEIHCHLEGSIRTQTIIDIAKEYNLELPSYEVDELDKHVKVYDQMQNLEAVLAAFAIFPDSSRAFPCPIIDHSPPVFQPALATTRPDPSKRSSFVGSDARV